MCGVSQRARSTAPTVLAREMHRPALRPYRSAIVRLRSGMVASRSGAFRIAAFRCGGGGPRGWHGRAGASARRSLRPRLPVRRRVRASSAHERHPTRSEYLPSPACRPCAAMRASRRPSALRPRSRRASAGALSAHVRFRGARSARLTVSKVGVRHRNCDNPFPCLDLQIHTQHGYASGGSLTHCSLSLNSYGIISPFFNQRRRDSNRPETIDKQF